MADAKITALTALTTPNIDDLYVIVDDVAGTPVTKKIKLLDQFFPLYKILTSDNTGTNGNSAQPWFPTSGGVTLEAGATYLFEGQIHITRSAGSTSHTTGFSFGGTATITTIQGHHGAKEGDAATFADMDRCVFTSASNLQVKGASTSTTEVIVGVTRGFVVINAGGTFIPQFTYSAAPGGAPTIKAGTFFMLHKLPASTSGTWS